MSKWLFIEPFDRVVIRDGRPFGEQNARLYTLPWPVPSTLAGAVRSAVGIATGLDDQRFSPARAEDLKAIAVAGPFLFEDNRVYLPAPRDAWIAQSGDGQLHVGA
ncbi:MAG: CRISPR-associated protein Cmr3, partial [Alicyclobacillus sp.]|nr:CRISPR-associated protein Cmr3 [Alicyclobacillus sp.]